MNDLKELDSLTVTCIVDNECDTMSSGIDHALDGFEYQSEQTKHSGADKMCVAAHGLSLLLTASTTASDSSKETHTLLLDAGPTPSIWKQNADKLDIDFASIEAAVLSHYHYDHSGGLKGAVRTIVEARNKMSDDEEQSTTPFLVDLQSSGIVSRGRKKKDDEISLHQPDNPTAAELTRMGAVTVELHDEPHTLCNNSFYVSGYIPRKDYSYETGMPPTHVTLMRDGTWQSDKEIRDERYVACNIKNHGLVVFSACSHAGINNVCRDAMKKSGLPIFGIVGGLHLAGAFVEERIRRTVDDLKQDIQPSIILGGHCTGWRGKAALAAEFSNHFQPLAVGGTYIFHNERKK